MTLSILCGDAASGHLGGAAATGSLCVGGWVLRGDAVRGLSASQGSIPSTIWGTDCLARMARGISAADAVTQVTQADPGRAHRQITALDPSGRTGAFTGESSVPASGARQADGLVVAGNMLASEDVLDAAAEGLRETEGALARRLLDALCSAVRAGGDHRGLVSAAILVVGPDIPPLTLRIDRSEAPLADLSSLLEAATRGDYARWTASLPTLGDPYRAAPGGSDPAGGAAATHNRTARSG